MKYLIYALIAVTAGLVIFYLVANGPAPKSNGGGQDKAGRWETKTDDTPPVTIDVVPVELGASAEVWKFNIRFTTHSGNLDEDPAKAIILVDDKSKTHKPTAWEGPGPGGHHIQGVLAFKAVTPTPSSVELKIRRVGGVPERSFRWNLRQAEKKIP